MTRRIIAAVTSALRPRVSQASIHTHLDVDGEYVCEDFRCPARPVDAVGPGALNGPLSR